MVARDAVGVAARNNAEWCDAFCRARGIAGRFDEDAWSSAERTPPFYPDAITLVPGADARSVLSRIDDAGGCSIKDSFGDLDLAAAGFEVLFRAEWLWLEAPIAASGWSHITSTTDLAEWEEAWGESLETPPFFRPELLADESVAILARRESDRIVAGAIANRSATVVGLSNVFAAGGELEAAYRGAAGAAQKRWGVVPVVGYDSGEALDGARRAGFVSVGELAVWMR